MVDHFNRNKLGNTQRGLVFLNLKKFHLLVTFFSYFLFTVFTVYNLNKLYFIYELCSKFQKKQFGQYSRGIGALK